MKTPLLEESVVTTHVYYHTRTMKLGLKHNWIYAWLWTISTTYMTYSRSQNYTNMCGWQTWHTNIWSCGCRVVSFIVIIWCLCPHKCTSLVNFEHVVCPNILKMLVMTIPEVESVQRAIKCLEAVKEHWPNDGCLSYWTYLMSFLK